MADHVTVLTDEAIDALCIKKGSTIVDATLGAAGHTKEILARLERGVLVGVDQDEDAIKSREQLKGGGNKTHLVVGNFRSIDSILQELGIEHVDGILADLGWRMEQFSGNGRGFSFKIDEPLIMSFGDPKSYPFVAGDIVNEWDREDIRNVLKAYGEERFAGRIARTIVEHRSKEAIITTFDLVRVIKEAVPAFYLRGKVHPATRTFQALRIAVNDELDALEEFVHKSIALLNPKGRLAIISFHSLEDRIVKHTFRAYEESGAVTRVVKRPVTPTEEEKKENPRARSAKLRIVEKNEEV